MAVGLATLAVAAALQGLGAPLATPEAPLGIVSFEFAGSGEAARAMLDAWGEAGRVRAGLSLGLDFLFLVLYATSIALACARVAERLGPPASPAHRLGALLAWAQPLAAAFDALENTALVAQLLGSRRAWAPLAAGCAAVKFALVGAGLAFAAGGLAVSLARRKSRPGPADGADRGDERGDHA